MYGIAKSLAKGEPFKKPAFPKLKDLAIEEVALNFKMYPELEGIPDDIKEKIIEKTSVDWEKMPIQMTAPNINSESYWKKACQFRWKDSNKSINLELHGRSWKVAYLERSMEEYLQNLNIDQVSVDEDRVKQLLEEQCPDLESTARKETEDKIREEQIDEMKMQAKKNMWDLLKSSSSWVHTLNITYMRSSLDISEICKYLPLITEMSLTYGYKKYEKGLHADMAKLNQKQNLNGMKLSEAAQLGDSIQKWCNNLLTLKLPANLVDDDLLRFIMKGVNENSSLIELNLSHNKISDQGARRLAKFLMRNEILLFLDLSNNMIGYEGCRFIAQALKINKSLKTLNLRLNNFSGQDQKTNIKYNPDKAGMKLFKDLTMNQSLLELNVSGNQLGVHTAIKLNDYLADNECSLQALYIGNNNFGPDSFDHLRSAFQKNKSLKLLEIRGCRFYDKNSSAKDKDLANAEKKLTQIILEHTYNAQKIPLYTDDEYEKKKQQNSAEQPPVEEVKRESKVEKEGEQKK